jgi:AraC family transcriptional regulator, regulatory protein of adaptative response / DNA-3-methyladenine glycosylase II
LLTPIAGRPTGIEIEVATPYASAPLLRYLAAKAVPGVEEIVGERYVRTLRHAAGVAVLSVDFADAGRGLIRATADGVGPEELEQRVGLLVDATSVPARISEALAADERLRQLLDRWPGIRIPGTVDPFELAVRTILGQQITVAAAARLAGRLVSRLGGTIERPLGKTAWIFPSADVLSSADLTGLGIPDRRANAIARLARAVVEGHLSLDGRSSTSDSVGEMIAIPGIGPWTVAYVRLRGFADRDAIPLSDLGLRSALTPGEPRLTAREFTARSEGWRPWRGYGALLLWSTYLPDEAA